MASNQLPGSESRCKARLAAFLRRVPFVLDLGVRVWRLQLPRFTAGVVGVIVNAEGRILLLKHVYHTRHAWGLPGGWVDRRESPGDALIRELVEETGMDITLERPLLNLSHPRRAHIDFAYLCHPHGDVRHLNGEILAYNWVKPSSLPPLAPFHVEAIAVAFRHRTPSAPIRRAHEAHL